MYRVSEVEPLENYRVQLSFSDGTSGTADLSDLAGRGVFALWNDYDQFRKVKIGEAGELVWSDQIDLCPDSLYLKVTRKAAKDIFPALKREQVNA